MSKTIKILWLVSLVLVAASAATCYFGPDYEFSLLPKPEESSSHGGFTISGPDPVYHAIVANWIAVGGLMLIGASAFAFAAVKLWRRDKREQDETLKQHFAHSRIINIEGKR